MTAAARLLRPLPLALVGLLAAAGMLVAQIEPGERGVPPINTSNSYEVSGVAVDVVAKDAESARMAGWRLAQRLGWKMLYARTHGVPPDAAPVLPDSTLDAIVESVVVESEEVSDTRYIARLGIEFDRARTGEFLGVGEGGGRRSAAMLVIPLMWTAGTPQVFEVRTEWQKAWARFRAGSSPVDYVRPYGNGADPLVLNAAQTRRPGRAWWHALLDQYGAADVVVPEVHITRAYPGGPIFAQFVARHGPDGEIVDTFSLTAPDDDALPAMLDEGVRRTDAAYIRALEAGTLSPDPSLTPAAADATDDTSDLTNDATTVDVPGDGDQPIAGTAFTLQVDTPDAAALATAEQAVRAVPGVTSSTTSSLALGGVSLIRIVFQGDREALGIALAARGYQADGDGTVLRLRRSARAALPEPDEPVAQ